MKTYTLTEAQFEKLLETSKPVTYLVADGIEPMYPQENANAAWAALGRELGFDSLTVRPGDTRLEFTAEPTP